MSRHTRSLLSAGASAERVCAAIEELTQWRRRATKASHTIAILEGLMVINIALNVLIQILLL